MKTQQPVRKRHVSFFLTNEDADRIETLALSIGLRSRGTLLTWFIEGILNEDFSPIGGARVCSKLLKAMKESGMETTLDFKTLWPRKLPNFPDVELTAEDYENAIRELQTIKQQLEKKEK